MNKILNSIKITCKQHSNLIMLLLLIILAVPQMAHIDTHIMHNKYSYLLLFFVCGILITCTSKLYKKEDFIHNIKNYIITVFCLDFIITYIFLMLAFGGKQGAEYLNLLTLIPGEYFIYSLSTKYTMVALMCYSFWFLIYLFVRDNVFGMFKNSTLYKRIIYAGYILILFYPALHYYFFDSKVLLKQLMK